jgi:uncharacterized protein (DUF2336 family)
MPLSTTPLENTEDREGFKTPKNRFWGNRFLRHAGYNYSRTAGRIFRRQSLVLGARMVGKPSLIAELEDAMASRSDGKRTETLQKVTDLFVGNASNYSEEQVALFDNVIGRLADGSDVSAKAELSKRLASVENAPVNVVQSLASDDVIDVAGPVLAHSKRLDEAQLADLAATKGRKHMLAIAGRKDLSEQVTDALLTRGDQHVARTVAGNASARVSEKGYETLVDIAADDASFVECLAQRQDIPQRHFRTLVALAPEAVQRRLATTNPKLAERIRQAILEAEQEAPKQIQRDYAQAMATVAALSNQGTLVDETVLGFAKDGHFEEAVAALAHLADLPIETTGRLITNEPTDTILIVAKAVGLTWPTAKSLLQLRTAGRSLSPGDLDRAKGNFVRLGPVMAKQGLTRYKARANQS